MDLARRAVLPLRLLLVVAFGLLLVLQTLSLPGQLAHEAEQDPGSGAERWVLLAILVAGLACVQVVIVCTWRLLAMVQADRIFSTAAFRWVDGIIGAVGLGCLLLLGLFLWVGVTADDPGAPLLLLVLLTAAGVLALLVVVMRALLVQATALRTDLDQVI